MYDDLEYLRNELGMKITVARQDSYVILSQPDSVVKLYFRWEPEDILFDYMGKEYRYSPHLFQNFISPDPDEKSSATSSGDAISVDPSPNGAIGRKETLLKIVSGLSFAGLLSRFSSIEISELIRVAKESLSGFLPQ